MVRFDRRRFGSKASAALGRYFCIYDARFGTAVSRYDESAFNKHIYVVGNEQNYHFQVLKVLIKKLGYPWADNLIHLSYGMVELPDGRMKSREGTVVDADDLMDQMVETARITSGESAKLEDMLPEEKEAAV